MVEDFTAVLESTPVLDVTSDRSHRWFATWMFLFGGYLVCVDDLVQGVICTVVTGLLSSQYCFLSC